MRRPSIIHHQRLLSNTIYMGISCSALVPINLHKFVLTNADSIFHKYTTKHCGISNDKEHLQPQILQLVNNACSPHAADHPKLEHLLPEGTLTCYRALTATLWLDKLRVVVEKSGQERGNHTSIQSQGQETQLGVLGTPRQGINTCQRATMLS